VRRRLGISRAVNRARNIVDYCAEAGKVEEHNIGGARVVEYTVPPECLHILRLVNYLDSDESPEIRIYRVA
jgi:hypothetical protein